MVNTCPNCSHPLRPGAKFCGYCGTDITASSGGKNLEGVTGNSLSDPDYKGLKRANSGHKDPFRTLSIIAIVLMIVIILAALTWQYWAYILPVASQLLPGLFIK